MTTAQQQAATERAANAAWDEARDRAREKGASRQDAEAIGQEAAGFVVAGWDKAQRSHRLMRDRWERCRQRWQGRTPSLRIG